ncbi:hypothetical protein BBJ28_00016340, partial [Nothophytophthora sp. Chile5]
MRRRLELLEAVKAGRVRDVQTVLECGEDADERDEDGWTPLTTAAADGHVEILTLLLQFNASINVPNQWGETALSRSAFGGHLEAARTLLDHGAAVDLADEDGDTPLIVAAIRGHVDVARLLLEKKATADARNKVGVTALQMAETYGQRDVVLLIQENQNTLSVGRVWQTAQSLGGWVTQFVGMAAPTKSELGAIGEDDAASPELRSGLQTRKKGDDDQDIQDNQRVDAGRTSKRSMKRGSSRMSTPAPTVTSQLGMLLELVAGMAETQDICEDVLERLQRAQYRLDEMGSAVPFQTKANFQQITTCFHAFLVQHTKQSTVERLVGTRTVLGQLRGFHCELDGVEAQLATDRPGSAHSTWEEKWESAVLAVEKRLQSSWEANIPGLFRELPSTESQTNALLLLNSETERHQSSYSAKSQQLLQSVTKRVARMSGAPIPVVPQWFVPSHEVQRQAYPFASGSFGEVYRGTWRGSKVVIKCVNVNSSEDRRAFLREATIWHKARHPHIVSFFGACHQSRPCFFICEEAANGNLVDYLDKMKKAGRSLVWRKLHEAALGLQFLHQNGIVHGDLKCNQILVSGEGVAKLTDFGLSFVSSESRPEGAGGAIRWRAPECLTNEGLAPTLESDVYSFGMCVVEAVTYDVPWGVFLPDMAVIDHLRHRTFLPRPNDFVNDAEWDFVLSLCAFEPSRRLKLPDAIERLRMFADGRSMEQNSRLSRRTGKMEVEYVAFSEEPSSQFVGELQTQKTNDAMNNIFRAMLCLSARRRFLRLRRAVQTLQRAFRSKKFVRFVRVVRLVQCRFRYRSKLELGVRRLQNSTDVQHEEQTQPSSAGSVSRISSVVKSTPHPEVPSTQTVALPSVAFENREASDDVEPPLPTPLLPQHPLWVNDEERFDCHICKKDFNLFRRKHHCRVCGEIVCKNCCLSRSMRVCVSCMGFRLAETLSSAGVKTLSRPGSQSGFWRSLTTTGLFRTRARDRTHANELVYGTTENTEDVESSVPRGQMGLWDDDVITAARIPRDQVIIRNLVGRGAFGEVYLGLFNGAQVAVKMLPQGTRKDVNYINAFLEEAKLAAGMEHPNIVNLVGVAWNSLTDLCVVMEHMDGGDLRSLLNEYEATQHAVGFDREKTTIAFHVSQALTYLHSLTPSVIHRDLKSRNILLNRAKEAKLTDFGVSRELIDTTMTAGVGTSLWMAPEVLLGERYDEKADMFSFGVVMSELDVHVLPYTTRTTRQLPELAAIQMVVEGTLSVEFSQSGPQSMAELGRECVTPRASRAEVSLVDRLPSEPSKANPLDSASLLSIATIWWLQPMLKRGYKAPLDEDSVWDLPLVDQAHPLQQRFDAAYVNEAKKNALRAEKKGVSTVKRPNVNFALWQATKDTYMSALGCYFVNSVLVLVQPFLIKAILQNLEGESNMFGISSGYGLAVLLGCVAFCAATAINAGQFLTARAGCNARMVVINSAYQKILRL